MIIGRHTGQAIKQQFDSVCKEFHIAHKTNKSLLIRLRM